VTGGEVCWGPVAAPRSAARAWDPDPGLKGCVGFTPAPETDVRLAPTGVVALKTRSVAELAGQVEDCGVARLVLGAPRVDAELLHDRLTSWGDELEPAAGAGGRLRRATPAALALLELCQEDVAGDPVVLARVVVQLPVGVGDRAHG
jgi:hypothetical protein